jgi:hypothetical protein
LRHFAVRVPIPALLAVLLVVATATQAAAANPAINWWVWNPPSYCVDARASVEYNTGLGLVVGAYATSGWNGTNCTGHPSLPNDVLYASGVYWDMWYPNAHVCDTGPGDYNPSYVDNIQWAAGRGFSHSPCTVWAAVETVSWAWIYPNGWQSSGVITNFICILPFPC